MIKTSQHNKEAILKKQLSELEEMLELTKEELKKSFDYNKELEAILEHATPVKKSKIITLKSATKIEFINVDHILYCTADESYSHIELLGNKTITVGKPLSSLEKILEGHSFFRISKSQLINIDYITTFHKNNNTVVLNENVILDVTRRRRIDFLKMLK